MNDPALKTTLTEDFMDFLKSTYPASQTLHPEQFTQVKAAFMAGSQNMLYKVKCASDELSEVDACKKLTELNEELGQWIDEYKKQHGVA